MRNWCALGPNPNFPSGETPLYRHENSQRHNRIFQKVVPFLDLRRIDAHLLAKLFIVPEDDRSHIAGQSVRLSVDDEILNAGWIEGVSKLTGDRTRDILADTRLDLFLHYAAAPAMKHAGFVLCLQERWQFRFEGLVLEVIELNFDAGMALFVFIRSGPPDIANPSDRTNVQDFDYCLSRRSRNESRE